MPLARRMPTMKFMPPLKSVSPKNRLGPSSSTSSPSTSTWSPSSVSNPRMTEAEIRTGADIWQPSRVVRESGNGVEHVKVDAEHRGHLAEPELDARTQL